MFEWRRSRGVVDRVDERGLGVLVVPVERGDAPRVDLVVSSVVDNCLMLAIKAKDQEIRGDDDGADERELRELLDALVHVGVVVHCSSRFGLVDVVLTRALITQAESVCNNYFWGPATLRPTGYNGANNRGIATPIGYNAVNNRVNLRNLTFRKIVFCVRWTLQKDR